MKNVINFTMKKLSKKAAEAKKMITGIYPTARLLKSRNIYNEGCYGIFVPTINNLSGFWLTVVKENNPTGNKAWIYAAKKFNEN